MAIIRFYKDDGTGYNYDKYRARYPGYSKSGYYSNNGIIFYSGKKPNPENQLSPTEFSTLWVTQKTSSLIFPDYYYKSIFKGSGFKQTRAGGMGDLHATEGTITEIEFRNHYTKKPVITIEDINYSLISGLYYSKNKSKYDGVKNPLPISLSFIPFELISDDQFILFYDDEITGSEGGDTLGGFNGDDAMTGNGGNDKLYGNQGEDTLWGNRGFDTLYGGKGEDTLYGGKGNDELYGNKKDDLIYGNKNNDTIYGGEGADTIFGGSGNDIITGGKGEDHLYGNSGADTFRFGEDHGRGINIIYDFNPIEGDRIKIARGLKFTYTYIDNGVQLHTNEIRFDDGGYVLIGGIYADNIDSFIYKI